MNSISTSHLFLLQVNHKVLLTKKLSGLLLRFIPMMPSFYWEIKWEDLLCGTSGKTCPPLQLLYIFGLRILLTVRSSQNMTLKR